MRSPLALVLPLCLFGLSLAIPRSAGASILQTLDTPELVRRAEHILVGTVEGQRSHWADESHSAIVTDVNIRVTTALRGARAGDVVTVRRLGGTVDGIGMRVFGEASYAAGEEVLLFAERRGEALYAVGMTQGKLHVNRDGVTKSVSVDLQGAELLPPASGPLQPQPGGPSPAAQRARPLKDVLKEVSALVLKDEKGAPRKAVPR